MRAADIAEALGGKREGCEWRCPCPVHGGKSLMIGAGRSGKVLLHCKGGCQQDDVLAKLVNFGLFENERIDRNRVSELDRTRQQEAERRVEIDRLGRRIGAARAVYDRAVPAPDTVERYLRSRGIALSVPNCLRFLQHCPHRHDPRYDLPFYPAMVAPVLGVTGQLIGVHKTFLRLDGSGKADLPKELQRESCGPIGGGAVRLAMPRHAEELIIDEGIETVLSAIQMFGLPGWAALSAPGLAALELPPTIRSILVCADHDANAVGLEAALTAKARWILEGRNVRLRWPRNVGEDFNDILRSRN
jgi:putative DNA primase/helicase